MIENNLISLMLLMPLLGALLILFVPRKAIIIGIIASGLSFIISIYMYTLFDNTKTDFQFNEVVSWIESFNIYYRVGVDGISLPLILLTSFLTPICILASTKAIKKNLSGFIIAFLLLETLVMGVFCALDLILFYLCFEAMLIPMYMVIGIWGGEDRVYAAYKFFLYTLAGSLLLLLAIIFIYISFNTMDITVLTAKMPSLDLGVQRILWLALFASFAVKIPMWPFHTWLPYAHVQAPTAGSVILAGILIKMGAYGFIRFSLPMLPEASKYFADLVFFLSVVAVIYASLVAIAQSDMKKMIAYSSIAHMGFVTIGIFSFNIQGMTGAMVQIISHGLVSAALFLCVGVLYEQTHTKAIKDYGSVAKYMPKFAFIMMLFTMASVGLPGTSGFVGEIMVLAGSYKTSQITCILAATGLVFGACYMLMLYKKVMLGDTVGEVVSKLKDVNCREMTIFVPLMLLVLYLGIYPKVLTNIFYVNVAKLAKEITLGK
jgi:NADH-quinone oxidoreductase subunit M